MVSGIGVGVGLGGARRMTPAQLTSQLQSVLGASLTGLWLGEDMIVDDSNNVTSWPGRVGPTLTNVGSGRFVRTTFCGKVGAQANSTQTKLSSSTSVGANVLTYISVAEALLPAAAYNVLFRSNPGIIQIGLTLNPGGSWDTSLSTIYQNGTANAVAAASPRIIEAKVTSGTQHDTAAFGYISYTFLGKFGMGMTASANLTPEQRTAVNQVLSKYYSIKL